MSIRPVPPAVVALLALLWWPARTGLAQESPPPPGNSDEIVEQAVSGGNTDEAVAACTKRIESNPRDAAALAERAGLYDTLHLPILADADCAAVLKAEPISEEPLVECARRYFFAARFAEAIVDLDAAIRINPANLEAFQRRSDSYHALDNFGPALADFTRALALESDSSEKALTRYCRAELEYENHHDEQALADFTDAASDGLDCAPERGNCLLQLHRWREAEAVFTEILRSSDDKVYDPDSTRQQLTPMPAPKGPADPAPPKDDEVRFSALCRHAVACAHLGRFDTAESDLAEAIAMRPKDAGAYSDAAWTRLFAGKPREARDAALQALKLDPGEDSARVNLAHAYLLEGRFDWALSIYLEAKGPLAANAKPRVQVALEDFAELRAAGNHDPNIARMADLLRQRSVPPTASAPTGSP